MPVIIVEVPSIFLFTEVDTCGWIINPFRNKTTRKAVIYRKQGNRCWTYFQQFTIRASLEIINLSVMQA